MPDITTAVDETAANTLMATAISTLPPFSTSGSSSLGPFSASYGASGTLTGGTVDLIPPDIIRVVNGTVHYSLNLTFSLDLNSFLPHFCLPRICIPTPWGSICSPSICITWPTITVPLSHSGTVRFTADFRLNVHQSAGDWLVDVSVAGIPNLQVDAEAALILSALGVALGLLLAPIPFIGPFLAGAIIAITAAIGLAGVTGWLGPILSPFVAGRTVTVFRQPRNFTLLPAGGAIDPAVNIILANVAAAVQHNAPEDELVLTVDVTP